MSIEYLTSEKEINRDLPWQVLYFYLSDMPYYSKLQVMLEQWQQTHPCPIFALDAAQFKGQCRRFEVISIPTVILLMNGMEMARTSSWHTKTFTEELVADI